MGNLPAVTLAHYTHSFEQQQHTTAETMVDAITKARAAVLETYSLAKKRRPVKATGVVALTPG
jgi:hypothetical protein